jgi:hypothetical protein
VWTDKQKRKYEHIRDSEEAAGRVHQAGQGDRGQDREQGAGPEGSDEDRVALLHAGHVLVARGGLRSGTSRPKGRTKAQLYNEAKNMGIKGRSRMNKEQLQRAVDRKKS